MGDPESEDRVHRGRSAPVGGGGTPAADAPDSTGSSRLILKSQIESNHRKTPLSQARFFYFIERGKRHDHRRYQFSGKIFQIP
jgi:hypothetical protein